MRAAWDRHLHELKWAPAKAPGLTLAFPLPGFAGRCWMAPHSSAPWTPAPAKTGVPEPNSRGSREKVTLALAWTFVKAWKGSVASPWGYFLGMLSRTVWALVPVLSPFQPLTQGSCPALSQHQRCLQGNYHRPQPSGSLLGPCPGRLGEALAMFSEGLEI